MRSEVRQIAPAFSSAPRAALTFGRLAPSSKASSPWENPSSGGTRRPGGRRAPRRAVQYGDLADEISRDGDLETQSASTSGSNCQPDLAFRHWVEKNSNIALPEQNLSLLEAQFLHFGSANRLIVSA
jgi:hypothetical protein